MFHVEQKNTHIKTKDFFLTKEVFSVIKTEQEGLLKTDPFPPKEEIQKYYNAEDYFSHNSKSGNLLSFFYRLFRAINFKLKYNPIKHLLNQGSLLDFGCGEGYFLRQMNSKGYSSYGVDPFRNKSKKISQSIFDEELSDIGFKTITAWHSIEHVYDLEKTIIRFHDVLLENGLVVVAVPNYNSYDAKHYKNLWAGYDTPRHLWHFNKTALRKVFERNKFIFHSTYPLFIDAYYVSFLSEKYKGSKLPILRSIVIGTISNLKAFFNGQYSSNYFVFKKTQEI